MTVSGSRVRRASASQALPKPPKGRKQKYFTRDTELIIAQALNSNVLQFLLSQPMASHSLQPTIVLFQALPNQQQTALHLMQATNRGQAINPLSSVTTATCLCTVSHATTSMSRVTAPSSSRESNTVVSVVSLITAMQGRAHIWALSLNCAQCSKR